MVRMNDNFGESRRESSYAQEDPRRCRIKEKWEGAGRTGKYYGNVSIENQKWAIVVWDDEEDPDLHKLAGIEIATETWITP